MKTRRITMMSCLAVVGVLVLAACGSEDSPSGEAATAASRFEPASVTYLTSFGTFGRDAFVYAAEEQGFFDEVNIDVTIEPGSGSVDVMKLIAGGRADFGAADFSAAVVTVANERLPVTVVGIVHQRSLAAIVSLAEYGISKPADLVGKVIGDQPGSTNQIIFPTYAKAAGIDANAVKFVPSSPPSLPQLLAGHQVDAIGQFVVGRPLIEAAAPGKDVTVLPYGDLLPDLYGGAIMTSDDLAKTDPELVKRFIGALMKGVQYSIEHPEETGRYLQQAQPTQNAEVAAAEIKITGDYVRGPSGVIGSIDRERVDRIIKIMGSAITGQATPEDLVSFDLASQP